MSGLAASAERLTDEADFLDVPAQLIPVRRRWLPAVLGVIAAVVGLGFTGDLLTAPSATSADCDEVAAADPSDSAGPYEVVVSGIVPAGTSGVVVRVTDGSGHAATTTIPPRTLPAVFVSSPIDPGWAAIHGSIPLP